MSEFYRIVHISLVEKTHVSKAELEMETYLLGQEPFNAVVVKFGLIVTDYGSEFGVCSIPIEKVQHLITLLSSFLKPFDQP